MCVTGKRKAVRQGRHMTPRSSLLLCSTDSHIHPNHNHYNVPVCRVTSPKESDTATDQLLGSVAVSVCECVCGACTWGCVPVGSCDSVWVAYTAVGPASIASVNFKK